MQEKLDSEEIQTVAFTIISHSGEARTKIHEAFRFMRQGDYDESEQSIEKAKASLLDAHKAQTDLLKQYASGVEIDMEIIMVHAQDHLMTTMTLQEMAEEMTYLYKKQDELSRQLSKK